MDPLATTACSNPTFRSNIGRLTLIAFWTIAFIVQASESHAAKKFNFIFINIDDLGYADIGPFGSQKNKTPNLDRMAKEGRKLTCFYAAPVCSPS